MAQHAGFPILVAGIGIGVAATLVFMDDELRSRLWNVLGRESQRVSDARDKLRNKLDDAADATKKMMDQVAEKSRDAAHRAGEQLERGGKRLQHA